MEAKISEFPRERTDGQTAWARTTAARPSPSVAHRIGVRGRAGARGRALRVRSDAETAWAVGRSKGRTPLAVLLLSFLLRTCDSAAGTGPPLLLALRRFRQKYWKTTFSAQVDLLFPFPLKKTLL
jgi:hypothetical protein